MTEKLDLSRPSLAGLSYALRHLAEVAPGHAYDHNHYARPTCCGTSGCAIGVAQVLWPEEIGEVSGRFGSVSSHYFGNEAFHGIFSTNAYSAEEVVTPERVADRIDEWLSKYGETRA